MRVLMSPPHEFRLVLTRFSFSECMHILYDAPHSTRAARPSAQKLRAMLFPTSRKPNNSNYFTTYQKEPKIKVQTVLKKLILFAVCVTHHTYIIVIHSFEAFDNRREGRVVSCSLWPLCSCVVCARSLSALLVCFSAPQP